MTSRERWWRLGALACLVAACGEAPPPPTAIESPNPPTGTNSAGQTNVLEALPHNPPASSASDATGNGVGGAQPPSSQALGADGTSLDAGVPPGALPTNPVPRTPKPGADVFGACRAPRFTDCEDLYVTYVSPAAKLCVQLSLDDCGVFRQSLQVTVPVTWRVSSATLGSADNCELGVYDPKSTSVLSASGTVTWTEDGDVLSDLEVNVVLQSPAGASTPSSVTVKTSEPIKQLVKCEN